MIILFVCAGNIMRSVMAESVLEARSREMLQGYSGILTAESCGLKAEPGSPPHREALRALENIGVPPCASSSSIADDAMMDRAALALTMTRQQCYVLADRFPANREKCYSLVEVNGAIEMLLEERGIEPGAGAPELDARGPDPAELSRRLENAVTAIREIPREKVRQIPGVKMDTRELMTHFAPCFYQASGIHDPLSGTPEDMARCAELVDREVTALVGGLLAIALH